MLLALFRQKSLFVLPLLVWLIAGPARLYGATYYVPGGFPTIQAAVNAAREGDTIIIAPGDYPENLVMTGVNMTLRSDDPTSPGVVAATRIGAPNGPVMIMKGTESEEFIIDGLTLTDGVNINAGAIYGNNSSATVTRCIIQNNISLVAGAFFEFRGRAAGNLFRNNISGDRAGGFLCADSPCIMENNIVEGSGTFLVDAGGPRVFRNNVVTGRGRYQDTNDSALEEFSGNTFTGNFQFIITAPPGLVFRNNVIRGYGSNLDIITDDALIESNLIEGSGRDYVFIFGGEGCIIRDFRVVVSPPGSPLYTEPTFGAAIYTDGLVEGLFTEGAKWGLFMEWARIGGPYGTLRNSVVQGRVGGVFGSAKAIENSTIVSPGTGLDILDADIRNSIVMGRYYGDLRFQNSLLDQYVETGTGNIYTSEPRFVDSAAGDYRLRPDSPAIDAGIKIPDLLTDHLGNPRPMRSRPWMNAGDNSGWDIGAYEYQDLIPLPVVEQQGWMLR